MSKEIMQFNNDTLGSLRAITDGNGDPWFVAKDVCDVLGITTANLSKVLDEDERRHIKLNTSYTVRGNPNMTIINESALYSLIFKSRKPEAHKFKRWVTSEVLPSIRKTGSYQMVATATPPDLMTSLEILEVQVKAMRDLKDEQNRQNTVMIEQADRLETIEHKIETNGCEQGYLPMRAAYRAYGQALSYDMFKIVVREFELPTKQYAYVIPNSNGDIAWATSVRESDVRAEIPHFIKKCKQVSAFRWQHPRFGCKRFSVNTRMV